MYLLGKMEIKGKQVIYWVMHYISQNGNKKEYNNAPLYSYVQYLVYIETDISDSMISLLISC